MLALHRQRLEALRDDLQRRGDRPSLNWPSADLNLVEALEVVTEYGRLAEAMYLMMAADHRVLNVERMVLRGALDVLSKGRVRTAHMEAMLEAASKRVAEFGEERCLEDCIQALKADPIRAQIVAVLAAAVAVADNVISEEERVLYERLVAGLGLTDTQADELLTGLLEPSA